MKKIYTLFLLITVLSLNAQTTVNYPQRVSNYDAIFTDGGGNFDQGTDEFGMWANFNAKQSAAFRSFTQTGLPGGTASTMAVGDSFEITLSATRAYGQIGISLLSSPSATATWADRHNNYAVQVNMNGESTGSYMPFEVVSNGGTVDGSSISGSTTYADFVFKFTLLTATTMEVSINTETFAVTLNNQNITGYSVYLADDWNGDANSNIYFKPTTEYVYAQTLNNDEFVNNKAFSLYPNPTHESFSVNTKVSNIKIYNLLGKLVKEFNGNFTENKTFDISELSTNVYLVKVENSSGKITTRRLIKQ